MENGVRMPLSSMIPAPASLVLTARGLTCIRGGRIVFRNLDFVVRSGEAIELSGPNGSGKSSLLRLVAGLVRLEAGTLALEGGESERTLAEQAHYCGHQDAIKPTLTVLENLAFWQAYLGERRADPEGNLAALAALHLDHLADLPAGYLSAGQRRRLALSRLVSIPRRIWLLDEPTAALDVASQAILTDLMRAHVAGDGLLLVATHHALDLPVRTLSMARH